MNTPDIQGSNQPAFQALIGLNREHSKIDKYPGGMASDPDLFIPTVTTFEGLANHIGQGFSWMPVPPTPGQGRAKENCNRAEVLALDFDHDYTLDEALSDPFFLASAGLITPTARHTTENHRFRVVFSLAKPIEGHEAIDKALRGLLALYPQADPTCKDSSRFFYGAKGKEPALLNPNPTPIDPEDLWLIAERDAAERKAPSAPNPVQIAHGDVPPIPLVDCIARNLQRVIGGVEEGSRNATAFRLAKDLFGTASTLGAMGIPFDGDPEAIYQDFCDGCSPPINSNEAAATWRSATGSNPTPSRNEDGLLKAWAWWYSKHSPKVSQRDEDDEWEDSAEAIKQRLAQQSQDFPLEKLFPADIAGPLKEFSARTGTPQGALGLCALTCLATLINPKTKLNCGGGTGRLAPAIIWSVIYGPSGSGKSHSWLPPLSILKKFSAEAADACQEKEEDYEEACRTVDRAKTKADREALSQETLDLAKGPEPDRQRFYLETFTVEALMSRSAKQQGRGLLAMADELFGWVARFDPAKGEEQFWLSFFDGEGYEGERIGRKMPYLPHSAISVMGGIQPKVFGQLVKKNMETQNGQLPRLLIVRMWDRPRPDLIDGEELDYSALEKVFRNIRDYCPEHIFKLGTGCHEFAKQLRKDIDHRRLSEHREVIKVLWPKYEGYVYRIALVLHLAQYSNPDKARPEEVSIDTLKTAWAFVQWLAGQAIGIYEELLEASRVDVRVTEFIEVARYKGWMSAKDVRLVRRRWFKDTKEAEVFMAKLVESGRFEGGKTVKGKPAIRFLTCLKSGNLATLNTLTYSEKRLQTLPTSGNVGNLGENGRAENLAASNLQPSDNVATLAATLGATPATLHMDPSQTSQDMTGNPPKLPTFGNFEDIDPEPDTAGKETPKLPELPEVGNAQNIDSELISHPKVAKLPLSEEIETLNGVIAEDEHFN